MLFQVTAFSRLKLEFSFTFASALRNADDGAAQPFLLVLLQEREQKMRLFPKKTDMEM